MAWEKLNLGSYSQFSRIFLLLTELRSFTDDSEIVATILEDLSDDFQRPIQILNNIIKELKIVDEHEAYRKIINYYSGDHEALDNQDSSIAFWGFEFFSAVQVDFIKAISGKRLCYSHIPKEVFDERSHYDWITWMCEAENTIILPDPIFETKAKFDVINKINLKNYLNENIILPCDLFLPYKFANIFSFDHLGVALQLEEDIFVEEMTFLSEIKDRGIQSFEILLNELILKFSKTKNPKILKIHEIIEDIFKKFQIYSNDNLYLNKFLIELVIDIVILDLPRNYFVVPSKEKKKIYLKDLAKLGLYSLKNKCYVGWLEDLLISQDSILSEYNIEKKLASIGPLKSSNLSQKYFKHHFRKMMSQSQNYIIIDESLLESFVEEFQFQNFSYQTHKYSLDNKKDILSLNFPYTKIDFTEISWSPTRLQAILDCSLMYHLKFNLNISNGINVSKAINARHQGIISHEVIEKSIKSSSDLALIVESVIQNTMEKEGLDVDDFDYYESFYNVKQMTSPVISLIQDLQNLSVEFYIEKKIDLEKGDIQYKAKIDFFMKTQESLILFDFKSYTDNSLKNEIIAMENIQLWFYLWLLQEQNKISSEIKNVYVGLINLKAIENSIVLNLSTQNSLSSEHQAIASLLASYDIQIDKSEISLTESLESFQKVFQASLQKLDAQSYMPDPRNEKICDFCIMSPICPRGRKE
jgi:hypothetical protein